MFVLIRFVFYMGEVLKSQREDFDSSWERRRSTRAQEFRIRLKDEPKSG